MVDKPAGLAVEAAASKSTRSVVRVVERVLGTRAKPIAVNELDRDASGVLLLASSPRVAELFGRALRRGARVWHALVEGEMGAEAGTLQAHLYRSARGVTEIVPEGTPTTAEQRAVLHYKVIGSGNGLSLLRLRGETDLPGQARALLAADAHPVVGDRAYSAARDDLGRLGLHLAELTCDEPRTKPGEAPVERRFKSPTPAAFWTAAGLEPPATAAQPEDRGWDHVSAWYDELINERRSDLHDEVVHPGVLALLDVRPGQRVLDIACGQGELARLLAAKGADVLGIDASPSLIETATQRSPERLRFEVADARSFEVEGPGTFDAAVCVLALTNMEPIGPVLERAAAALRPGGRFVGVVAHPAFRVPKASGWAWGETERGPVQRRLVERYLRAFDAAIVMNPGAASGGEAEVTTATHHRPIGAYVRAAADAGLLVDALEEWASHRVSEPGPRAAAENAARAEIPMFLAFRAVKAGAAGGAEGAGDEAAGVGVGDGID